MVIDVPGVIHVAWRASIALRRGFVVDMFHLDFMNFAIFNVTSRII